MVATYGSTARAIYLLYKEPILVEKLSFFDIISVDREDRRALHVQIYEAIRHAILDGKLRAGVRLPSTRTFASDLGIGRNTVIAAYEQLSDEGFLDCLTGSGTRVSALPELPPTGRNTDDGGTIGEKKGQAIDKSNPPRARRGASRRGLTLSGAPRHLPTYENPTFAPGLPAIQEFPLTQWARIVGRCARHFSPQHYDYSHMAGMPDFRRAVVQHLGTARGVVAEPDQIIVLTSAQAALDLLTRMTLDPGDVAWIEDPGYLGARAALIGAGASIVGVPLDDEGLDVAAGQLQSEKPPKLIYVTPSHQCPTGATMSLSRRFELLEFARRSGAWIIEDDYDSEFRYRGNPIASLQGLDRSGCVIYMGTFSKTMFPGLRIGYLVAPPDLARKLEVSLSHTGQAVPKLLQAAVSEFIREGYFAEHVRRMRRLYEERQRIFVSELRLQLSDRLSVQPSDTGIQLIAYLRDCIDDRQISTTAKRFNIVAPPTSRFFLNPQSKPGLFLGYAATAEERIARGVRELARAFEDNR
jgi:GntR family transcriptional regulator / MocR family aminotransferase